MSRDDRSSALTPLHALRRRIAACACIGGGIPVAAARSRVAGGRRGSGAPIPACPRGANAVSAGSLVRRGIAAVCVAVVLALPNAASALTSDREQPIEIEADSAEADDAKGITIYRGDVIITQGTLRITGDQVTIHYEDGNEFTKMITLGTPARFRQLPDGKEDVEQNYQHARASRMEYYKQKDTIVLLGNAVYGQGGDSVAADRIDYDSKNSRMKARTVPAASTAKPDGGAPSKGRVRITIQPKKKAN